MTPRSAKIPARDGGRLKNRNRELADDSPHHDGWVQPARSNHDAQRHEAAARLGFSRVRRGSTNQRDRQQRRHVRLDAQQLGYCDDARPATCCGGTAAGTGAARGAARHHRGVAPYMTRKTTQRGGQIVAFRRQDWPQCGRPAWPTTSRYTSAGAALVAGGKVMVGTSAVNSGSGLPPRSIDTGKEGGGPSRFRRRANRAATPGPKAISGKRRRSHRVTANLI